MSVCCKGNRAATHKTQQIKGNRAATHHTAPIANYTPPLHLTAPNPPPPMPCTCLRVHIGGKCQVKQTPRRLNRLTLPCFHLPRQV